MNDKSTRHRKQLLFSLCLVWLILGCNDNSNTAEKPATGLAADVPQTKNLLIFPTKLQTQNQAVNEFLTHAMTVAASGDYDTFRLLWSTKTEPLSKDDFEQGWHAVKAIRILAIEKVKVARSEKQSETEPNVAYLVSARVEFDQFGRQGKGIENREAICLIEYEQNQWRLANAPQAMRTWLRDKTASQDRPPAPPKPSSPSPTSSGS